MRMLLAAVLLCGLLLATLILGAWGPPSDSRKDPLASLGNKSKDMSTQSPSYSRSAYHIALLSKDKIDELAKRLSKEDADVILAKGTERAFCGTLLDNKMHGTYICKLCSLPLFSSESKFNSGTGWPSFFQPFDPDHIFYEREGGLGMERVEIMCARCHGHLGHVFDDGPKPTGLRYCLNSASLDFAEKAADGNLNLPGNAQPIKTATAYFAGGCFWGVEDRFQQTPGVISAVSGYMGGKTSNPTYKEICNGDTNHAETVMITFDPTLITYRHLLEKFFKYHNPTTLNQQGPDIGTQYRSAIFTSDDKQFEEAQKFLKEQANTDRFKDKKIVTQLVKAGDSTKFFSAEEYHQDYHEKNGGHCALPSE